MDLMNATSQLDDVVFRFEKFELIPGRRLLARDGRVVKVGSRAFDLLVALVERAGKVVRKDELVSCVWANVVVEDTNLRVHISSLRRLLGDDGLESRYIFVAPVLEADSDIGRPKRNAYRVLGEDSCRARRAVA
jgi:DNA-binding winged helix-turn-helix (wHTH) protein